MKRVVVIGSSCSGKTTLARRLAQVLNAPHVELDALHWGPNWTERPTEVLREAVSERVAGDSWVVDGNYTKVQDIVWPRATDAVWLNYPFPLVFGRALWRTLSRAVTVMLIPGVLGCVVAGAAVYGLSAHLLKCSEVGELIQIVRSSGRKKSHL